MVLPTHFVAAFVWVFLGPCRGATALHGLHVKDTNEINSLKLERGNNIVVAHDNNGDDGLNRKLRETSGGPTASPAPSPSPSWSPTIKPTHTSRPTMVPSHLPTESLKPSPSPSFSPSLSPTATPSQVPSTTPSAGPTQRPSQQPSEVPSQSPSNSPTRYPTAHPSISRAPSRSPSVSAQPSQNPSSRPSSAPSKSPSLSPTRFPTKSPSSHPSKFPSASPSSQPSQTPSSLPTDVPTVTASLAPSGLHTIRMSTTLAIVLTPLAGLLGGRVVRTFELQTMQFIQTTLPDLGNTTSVEILAVTITNQTMVTRRRRELSSDAGGRHLAYASLRIQFVVIGEFVAGTPPAGFNFAQYVDTGFLQHYSDYIYRLSSVDPVFRPLQAASQESTLKSQQSGSRTVSAAGVGMIVSGSIVAVVTAFAASIYAIRRRRPKGMLPMLEQSNGTFVEEVQPSGSDTPHAEYSQYSSERDSRESPLSHSSGGTYSTGSEENQSYDEAEGREPTSPNTMESGARTVQSDFTTDTRRSVNTEEMCHRDMAVEFSLVNHREEITHVGDVYEIYENESDEEQLEQEIMRYAARPPMGMSGRLLDTDSDEDVMHRHDNMSRPPEVRDTNYDNNQEHDYNNNSNHGDEFFDTERLEGYDYRNEQEAQLYDDEIHYSRSVDPPASDDGAPTIAFSQNSNSNAVDPLARKASDPFDPFNPSRVNMISLLDDNTTIGDTTVGESIATSGRESYGSEGAYTIGLKLTDEVLASFNGNLQEVEEEETPRKLIPRMSHSRFPELYAHTEDPYEELLEDSTPTSSAFSGVEATSEEFTDASIMGTLGARPITKAEMARYREKNAYNGVQVKRSGLYDVFAPPGPIGMVVDTTRDGPVVHTLKSTSPLIGLIYPGDLIVGLDDMDTRSMTAATLTRLMAKKSQQTERKITLLAVDK